MSTTLATGGRVHSPVSRDATAFAYDDSTLVWVGQDAPGPALHPDARRLDLEGRWVAPAFVECLAEGLSAEAATAAGTVPAGLDDPVAVPEAAAAVRAGRRVVASARDDLDRLGTELAALASELGGPAVARCTPTLVGTPASPIGEETLAALARVGVVLLLRPLVDPLDGLDVVRLAREGVVIALSCREGDGVDPWGAMRALVEVPGGHGLSPRAAFTAATRGSRAAGVKADATDLVRGAASISFCRRGPRERCSDRSRPSMRTRTLPPALSPVRSFSLPKWDSPGTYGSFCCSCPKSPPPPKAPLVPAKASTTPTSHASAIHFARRATKCP